MREGLPDVPIGIVGLVRSGPHDGLRIRIDADVRRRDGALVSFASDDFDHPAHTEWMPLADIGGALEGRGIRVEWPSPSERSVAAVDIVRQWFDTVEAELVEPFVSPSLNARPVRLLSAQTEQDRLVLEFDAMWDVSLSTILVLDHRPDELTLVAHDIELVWRNPEVASSQGRFHRAPLKWVKGARE